MTEPDVDPIDASQLDDLRDRLVAAIDRDHSRRRHRRQAVGALAVAAIAAGSIALYNRAVPVETVTVDPVGDGQSAGSDLDGDADGDDPDQQAPDGGDGSPDDGGGGDRDDDQESDDSDDSGDGGGNPGDPAAGHDGADPNGDDDGDQGGSAGDSTGDRAETTGENDDNTGDDPDSTGDIEPSTDIPATFDVDQLTLPTGAELQPGVGTECWRAPLIEYRVLTNPVTDGGERITDWDDVTIVGFAAGLGAPLVEDRNGIGVEGGVSPTGVDSSGGRRELIELRFRRQQCAVSVTLRRLTPWTDDQSGAVARIEAIDTDGTVLAYQDVHRTTSDQADASFIIESDTPFWRVRIRGMTGGDDFWFSGVGFGGEP